MQESVIYSIISVLVVSLISLIGIFTFSLSEKILKKVIIIMISFAAGALLGDTFIHLIPEAVKMGGLGLSTSLGVLTGFAVMFVVEKGIHWRHCHMPITANHKHPVAIMSLVGDTLHNFVDGLVIAASYIANIPLGIATTFAVILHEIPQEIADFGVLLHGGFSKKGALFVNFVTALSSVLGAVSALLFSTYVSNMNYFLLTFTAGTFIYIAAADLIPELHKEIGITNSLVQFVSFICGVGIMGLLLLIG